MSADRCASSSGCLPEYFGGRLVLASKLPVMWQVRMRIMNITGVLLASDSSKDFLIRCVIVGRLGRGSSSQICDFHGEGVRALLG